MGTDAKKKARKDIDSKKQKKVEGSSAKTPHFFWKKGLGFAALFAITIVLLTSAWKQIDNKSIRPEYQILSNMKMLCGEDALENELTRRIIQKAGEFGAEQLYVWEGEAPKGSEIKTLLIAIPKNAIADGNIPYIKTRLAFNEDGSDFVEQEVTIQMTRKDCIRTSIADAIKSYLEEMGAKEIGFQVTENNGSVIAMIGAPDTDVFVQNFAFIMKKYQTLDTETQFDLLKDTLKNNSAEK